LDFQARRLHITYRPVSRSNNDGIAHGKPAPLPFAHTLNGTAAAIPRLIIALLENGAQLNEAEQTVGLALPKALQPFWLGDDSLRPYARITWVDVPTAHTNSQQGDAKPL